ncbi:MAG: hypothetical protein WC814_01335 [Candidatus Paceibacterota bacterium]|jgi:hypothetical protein
MEPTVPEDKHDTAIAVIIGENTSDLILIRSRRTGLWRFPGDRIRDEDLGTDCACDRGAAAKNTVIRIARERTGLSVRIKRIVAMHRPIGMFYGYAGLADFARFAPRDEDTVKIFPFCDVPVSEMAPIQRITFERVIRWILE